MINLFLDYQSLAEVSKRALIRPEGVVRDAGTDRLLRGIRDLYRTPYSVA